MQGIDYPNVKVVVQYGMCPDLCSLIQRAGRAARIPGTEALFIYMVESWALEQRVNQKSAAYIRDPDTPMRIRPAMKGSGGVQWVGMASVAFATLKSCLRVELIKYLGDESVKCCESLSWTRFKRVADEHGLFNKMVL